MRKDYILYKRSLKVPLFHKQCVHIAEIHQKYLNFVVDLYSFPIDLNVKTSQPRGVKVNMGS